MSETLHILHTNDIHSHLNNWGKIVNVLKTKRSNFELNGDATLTFDVGDFVDRSHIIAEATLGKGNIALLNNARYDAITIGNNEGITLTKEALFSLYDEANFDVLLANVETNSSEPLPNTSHYKIYELNNKLKVGVIGLTAPFSLFYELLGMKVKEPIQVLQTILENIKEQTDVIILLSHLGLNEDINIAELYPQIDVILGAHTHHLLENGKLINETLIAQCGKHGSHVGHVALTFDVNTKRLVEKKAEVFPVEDYSIDNNANELLQSISEESIQLLNKPITYLKKEIPLHWFEQSQFADFLAQALKDWCNGDIGMVNAGILLEPLPSQVITAADLHRICPHPINPCNIEVTGQELKEIITQANTERMEKLVVKGLGFRGKVMGKMAFSGVNVTSEILADGKRHVKDIKVLGEPLDVDKTYMLSTVDMFTFGRLFPEIRNAKNKKYFMPELLRDVLEWALKKA